MDFTIYKVKSAKILNKSKDLNGFQGEILWQKYRIIEIQIWWIKQYQSNNVRTIYNSHRSNK